MNNPQRWVLYFVLIQAGFFFAQLLSSFGGYGQFVGLYLVLPLLVTELHYRYMMSANLDSAKAIKVTMGLLMLWGVVGAAVFGITINYFLPLAMSNFLLPGGLGLVVLKQMFIVAISLIASLIMYTRIARIVALRNKAGKRLVTV